MVIKKIVLFSYLFSFFACGQKIYKLNRDEYGQYILNDKTRYTFTEIPTIEGLKKIDTTAFYVQIFEGRYYNEDEKRNPLILIFHNDGFVRSQSLLYFGKFDEIANRNTLHYGRYRIIGNNIEIERFVSSPDTGDWHHKYIKKGRLEGDKIVFYEPLITVFEKRKQLPKIQK
ncbi:hypothetical protein LEQ04_03265 [Riemerella anatipestifer]|uniref:hypothetical protein n=1 Tax=Riemerella anatipestifer TaxID=34085 RepID=UPI000D68F2BD|nr:hypothetical protein [Riemerella anatipestifer]MRM86184.1 hypothetical protein [Riemerella anatipestifer]WPC09938.1 hypothetical protein LEQ05_07765 [Riemerella anatipestifer]WPC15912.1 hypothetical protein LEQ04_03265 [Riemerella anatipestifer]